MEVILGKMAGFCPGVTNTVIKTEKHVQQNAIVYCLGQLVHNKQVVGKLEKKGLKIVEDINDVPNGENLIIRAHGTTRQIYEKAREKSINIIDLTCPKVLEIHKQAMKYEKEGYYIIYIAEKGHPETIGTYSFCGENVSIIEELEDINNAIEDVIKTDIRNIAIISQTTFSLEKFDRYVSIIKIKIPKQSNLEVNRTICDATKLRQMETIKIAKQVELMIIIGGKKSSNTNKLYEIAISECGNAILVETVDDIFINYIKRFKKIGIMAGASTPKDIIEQIVEIVKNTRYRRMDL